jgi:hypothetical protein
MYIFNLFQLKSLSEIVQVPIFFAYKTNQVKY